MKKALILIILGLVSQNVLATETRSPYYAECKNLNKIKDVDDLLWQMYSNLDGDCLYQMPTKKLAKIWGVPIFDYADYRDDRGLVDRGKQYLAVEAYRLNAKKPSLYVVKEIAEGAETMKIERNRAFVDDVKLRSPVVVQQDNQYDTATLSYNGSLAQGQFPKYLPKPTVSAPLVRSHREEFFYQQGQFTPNTEYQNYFVYCWFDTQKTPKNYLAMTTSRFGVNDIMMSNHVSFFEQQCKQNPKFLSIRKGKIK